MPNSLKKISNTDIAFTIRILKALAQNKPFGIFKHFIMIQVLRNLKQPNVISADDIWNLLYERYDEKKLNEDSKLKYNLTDKTYYDLD